MNKPQTIELTQAEQELYELVSSWVVRTEWERYGEAMENLFKSLAERTAIPEIRLRIFADPEFAEKGKKSILQIFEGNGTYWSGNHRFLIRRHPHFIKYIKYMIEGPNLPAQAIEGFCRLAQRDGDQLTGYTRRCVRQYSLNRKDAATAFFRLCFEIDLGWLAKSVRKAAMNARNSRGTTIKKPHQSNRRSPREVEAGSVYEVLMMIAEPDGVVVESKC